MLRDKPIAVAAYDSPGGCIVAPSIEAKKLGLKTRIRQEIGEYLIASVGIAPNRFWAKLASSLKKPDGLITINQQNVSNILSRLKLSDIHGIKSGNIARLQSKGIFSPVDFYNASPFTLKQAFGGITGWYWHKRLHGEKTSQALYSLS